MYSALDMVVVAECEEEPRKKSRRRLGRAQKDVAGRAMTSEFDASFN